MHVDDPVANAVSTIVFFISESASPLGRDYRLRRCLTLFPYLKRNSDILVFGKGLPADDIERAGAGHVDLSFAETDKISEWLIRVRPAVAVFDMDRVPLHFTLLIRGMGAVILSMDHFSETMGAADIRVNSYRPDVSADFTGLSYWVPAGPFSVAAVHDTCASPHGGGGEPLLVFPLASTLEVRPGWLEPLFEALAGRHVRCAAVSTEARLLEGLSRDHRGDMTLLRSATAVVGVGMAELFNLMSLSLPVVHLALDQGHRDWVAELLPEGGVFQVPAWGEVDVGLVASMLLTFLENEETMQWNAALAGSIVSEENTEKVADIVSLVRPLDWDTTFFEFPVAAVRTLKLNEPIVHSAIRYCERNHIRLLQYLCDCHDRESVLQAEKNGFNFTDIRLTFESFLGPRQAPAPCPRGSASGRPGSGTSPG
jgi:hypothetical protein